jgi:hypothetical protein
VAKLKNMEKKKIRHLQNSNVSSCGKVNINWNLLTGIGRRTTVENNQAMWLQQ